MGKLRAIAGGATLLVLVVAGAVRLPPLPRFGPLVDPVHGVWALARSARLPRTATARITGLRDSVRVVYDDRGVPHIFARSTDDAVRALGYVVARDRLFQLELQTRATAGTLSELVGPDALPTDRQQRRLGLAWSAERDLAALEDTVEVRGPLGAYAQGVNAWIDRLARRDLPLEYRLLGAWPQRWKPVHSLYLTKRMGYTLAYSTHEQRRDLVEALVGRAAADALFPIHSPIQEPIVPLEGAPELDSTPVPPPLTLDSAAARLALAARGAPASRALPQPDPGWRSAAGSNNWAVAPARSASGHALLAGDPHLTLTLPSIWYEAHLVVPDTLDVYGVTLPGAPGIVIGFTRRVAWSFSNTEADVLDYYAERLDDARNPSAYVLDGAWRPLVRRIERYHDRRGRVLAVDTIYHTHRGPIVWDIGRPLSLRWTVLEQPTALTPLDRAARAASVDEWLRAMEEYRVPAQNGLVADRGGAIAIRSLGRFPLRPGDGRGAAIRDGSRSANDWTGYWPLERLPFARDPAQGYLASANQEPVAPSHDPGYLGVDWPSPWRALRINELLRHDSAVTPDAMRRYQTDPGSARADLFVPLLLEVAQEALSDVVGDDALREAAGLLAQWDRRYGKANDRAILFELAMEELEDRTWDELALPSADGEGPRRRVATPAGAVLARLFLDPTSAWWDDRRTDDIEDRDAIIRSSLKAALDRAKREHGEPENGGWRWSRIRHSHIWHLLGLRGLSRLDIPMRGGPGTLNPSAGRGTFGASWRMVVELGPEVRAWTIYPGGQSGNPVSARYDDRLARWADGQLDSVPLPRSPDGLAEDRVAGVLTLLPER